MFHSPSWRALQEARYHPGHHVAQEIDGRVQDATHLGSGRKPWDKKQRCRELWLTMVGYGKL